MQGCNWVPIAEMPCVLSPKPAAISSLMPYLVACLGLSQQEYPSLNLIDNNDNKVSSKRVRAMSSKACFGTNQAGMTIRPSQAKIGWLTT